jgi:probable HAF family extracellular repeat protein
MSKKFFSLSLFVLCFIPVFSMAQRYTITDLGPLSPTGINSWAQVVGNYNGHAFLWARGQGMRDLGLISGGTFSNAADVNDLGVVTGTADGLGTVVSPIPDYPNRQCSNLVQPFIWTRTNGIRGVGTLGSPHWPNDTYWCGQDTYGSGINNRGQGIGYTGNSLIGFDLYQFGLTWDSDGNITFFGGSWPPSFANQISDTGQIVGQNSEHGYGFQFSGNATSWKDGTATNLGTLPGAANAEYIGSAANGVNALGQIVGWSWTGEYVSDNVWPIVPEIHAVLWTANGIISDLGTLSGDTFSEATRINFFGLVIGSSAQQFPDRTFDSLGPQPFHVNGRPFIWSQRAGMRDLNTLIPQNSVWVLQSATDINVWGQIVGSGTRNGQPHGFLLTPLNPFQVF